MDKNSEHKHEKPRLRLVPPSDGRWEQLQRLQLLIDKYDGLTTTEKTQFQQNTKYFMIQTDLKDKLMPFRIAINYLRSIVIWAKERPDSVITTETMVAYSFYLLAVLFHKKFIYIETFDGADMPTVAGKRMEKHSALFIVQWESQRKHYKKATYGECLH